MTGALAGLIVTCSLTAWVVWFVVSFRNAPLDVDLWDVFDTETDVDPCRRCGGEGFDPKDDDPGYRLCPACLGGDW